MRVGSSFGILYATHLANEGFERFSVAHELGHYFLPGHIDAVLAGGGQVHTSRAGFVSDDKYENEADHFTKCPCGTWVDMRDPDKVLEHVGPHQPPMGDH